jgi:hypothetical protein
MYDIAFNSICILFSRTGTPVKISSKMQQKYFSRIIILVIALILLQINIVIFSQPELAIPDTFVKDYYIYFKHFPGQTGISYKGMLTSFRDYHQMFSNTNPSLLDNCIFNLDRINRYSYVKSVIQYITVYCYFSLLYNVYRLEKAHYQSFAEDLDDN